MLLLVAQPHLQRLLVCGASYAAHECAHSDAAPQKTFPTPIGLAHVATCTSPNATVLGAPLHCTLVALCFGGC